MSSEIPVGTGLLRVVMYDLYKRFRKKTPSMTGLKYGPTSSTEENWFIRAEFSDGRVCTYALTFPDALDSIFVTSINWDKLYDGIVKSFEVQLGQRVVEIEGGATSGIREGKEGKSRRYHLEER